jgi:hypothetical protein
VHSARFECYFVESSCVIVDLLFLSCFFIVDEIGGCCGAPSTGMGASNSENERVEPISNELRDDNRDTSKGKCKRL